MKINVSCFKNRDIFNIAYFNKNIDNKTKTGLFSYKIIRQSNILNKQNFVKKKRPLKVFYFFEIPKSLNSIFLSFKSFPTARLKAFFVILNSDFIESGEDLSLKGKNPLLDSNFL